MANMQESTPQIDQAESLIATRSSVRAAGVYFEMLATEPGYEKAEPGYEEEPGYAAWLCGVCGRNVLATPCPDHAYAAADLVRDYGLTEVVERASAGQDAIQQWTVVEVRRVYRPASVKDPVSGKSIPGPDGRTVKDPTKKGDTWRSLRPCTTRHTRSEALAALHLIAEQYDATVVTGRDGVPRLTVRAVPNTVYRWPITTHEFSLVPGLAAAKQRGSFDKEWNRARRQEAGRAEEIPLPLAVELG